MLERSYHRWEPLFSRKWEIGISETGRNIGKSYGMLWRALKRRKRHGEAMVWGRRTAEEKKSLLRAFGSGKWLELCKRAGVDFDRLRRVGDRIQFNGGSAKAPEWLPLIRYVALGEWNDLRDTDDPQERLFYVDEAFSTPEKLRRYHGDEVQDCIDAWISLRREGDMRLLLAGNFERAVNPYFDFFGVRRPEIKAGTVVLHPARSVPGCESATLIYERDPRSFTGAEGQILAGTSYGAFLAGGIKGSGVEYRRPPAGAWFYCRSELGTAVPVSIWFDRLGNYYISERQTSGACLRSMPDGRAETVVASPTVRKRLKSFRQAWEAGRVFWESRAAMERGAGFVKFAIN